MKLSHIFENLTYGELKQLGIGGFEEEGIQPENYVELVGHINLALQSLYTKFPLHEKELVIETQEDVFLYHLTAANARSVNVGGYIVDTVGTPFLEDVLRINIVRDSEGVFVPMNDTSLTTSVFTPAYDQLKIPFATGEEVFTLEYRAGPIVITVPTDPATLDLEQEVYLPDTLLEALLVYVSYRIHKGQGGELGLGLSSATKQHYEGLVAEVGELNLCNDAKNVTNIKPEMGGWV